MEVFNPKGELVTKYKYDLPKSEFQQANSIFILIEINLKTTGFIELL